MRVRHHPPIHLVVCGGSALIALRLVTRTTQDVDVLATLENGQLHCARPLPEWLLTAAEYTSPFLPSNTTDAFGSFASWFAKISASEGVEPCVAATVVGEDVVGGTVVAATMRELPGPLGAGNVESTTVVAPGTVVSVPVFTVPACNTGRSNN